MRVTPTVTRTHNNPGHDRRPAFNRRRNRSSESLCPYICCRATCIDWRHRILPGPAVWVIPVSYRRHLAGKKLIQMELSYPEQRAF